MVWLADSVGVPEASAKVSFRLVGRQDPAKIKEAFFTFPWEGSALKAEFKTEDRFVPITYQKDWSVVRKIDAASVNNSPPCCAAIA